MSLADLYRSAVLDHNRDPRHFEEMADATHQARGLNALCGDDLCIYLRLAGDRIEAASFIGVAGAITMASGSMMTEAVIGHTTTEARALKALLERLLREPDGLRPDEVDALGELMALEGVRSYPSRIRAALLPWEALDAALAGREVATTE